MGSIKDIGKIIYTSGAMKNVTNAQSECWRHKLEDMLGHEFSVFIPSRFFSYESEYQSSRQLLDYYSYMISKSEVVVVNLDYSAGSVGTGVEIGLAVSLGKPIIGIVLDNTDVYELVDAACTAIFFSLEEAADYIFKYYSM